MKPKIRIFITLAIIVTLLCCLLFSGCGCDHEWETATCTTPATCKKCGKTEGGLGEHSIKNGVCLNCGKNFIDFFAIYENCGCSDIWAEVGEDYLSVDTNPHDFSDSTLSLLWAEDALAAIKEINSKLGLPSYLYQEMVSTRAIDGRQTYAGSGVNVSWRFHPDSGLEVRYTK